MDKLGCRRCSCFFIRICTQEFFKILNGIRNGFRRWGDSNQDTLFTSPHFLATQHSPLRQHLPTSHIPMKPLKPKLQSFGKPMRGSSPKKADEHGMEPRGLRGSTDLASIQT